MAKELKRKEFLSLLRGTEIHYPRVVSDWERHQKAAEKTKLLLEEHGKNQRSGKKI